MSNENLTLADLQTLVNTVDICELSIDETDYTDWPANDQEGQEAIAAIEQRVAENRERLQQQLPEAPPSPSPSIQGVQVEGKEDESEQTLTADEIRVNQSRSGTVAGVRLQPHDTSRGGLE